MDAHQLFKDGKLAEAIAAQLPVVKAKPTDQSQRLFLFELLAFDGDLIRAQRQADALNYPEPELQLAVQGYRQALAAERTRRLVFTQKGQPEFFSEPSPQVRTRLLALTKLADGAGAEADQLFNEANAEIPPLKGSLNGKPFEGARDGDDRLGSVLEVFANGHYYWVPLEQVSEINMNPPRFPRDLLWIPAHLELLTGDAGPVFLPALYPGTEQESDAQLKLGRLTDWRGEPLVCGVGLKAFFFGDTESGILDWRKLQIAETA